MLDPLAQLDLNLLLALEALLAEGQVTRAARRMHVTQSAMSHMLGRLRDALDDEVMVRTPTGMRPTPRTLALAEPVGQALALLRDAVTEHRDFHPARYQGVFRMATIAAGETYAVPGLYRRLREEAPGATLDLCGGLNAVTLNGLARGEVDCVVVAMKVPAGLRSTPVLAYQWVTLARRGHPVVGDGLTLDGFTACEHALLGSPRQSRSQVDSALDELGLRRRVALRVQSAASLPEIVAHTDLLATTLSLVADRSAVREQLEVYPCPLPLPSPPFQLIWHPRTDRDPAQIWFRELVQEVVGGLGNPAVSPAE